MYAQKEDVGKRVTLVARDLEAALRRFLLNAFPFTSAGFRDENGRTVIEAFLDQAGNLLKGPWLELKLPFREADADEPLPFQHLSLPFRPWRHQVTAFRRLDPAAPRSTLIATGTGSGKTECFMLPILEYCLRHRQPGIKAIVVYPMNALATDQARRFAREAARLDTKLSVGLFTGDDGGDNRCMTPQQVITHRDTLREHPPDILLTNYKMLDFLLLRPRDQRLWRHNRPGTLRYLVVDELHTFDGAQGTDLACLIRRLRDRLGTGPELACVGTSATLGGAEAKQALADYACKIFAAPFDEEAVVMEERLAVEDYLRSLGAEAAPLADWPTDRIEALRPGHLPAGEWLREAARIWLGEDLPLDAREREEYGRAAVRLGELLGRHTAFHALVRAAAGLCDLNRLAADWAERLGLAAAEEGRVLLDSLCALVAAARIRTPEGKLRPFLQLRVQLWVRELRRMVASVSRAPVLRHADDLQDLAAPLHLPLLHCRECHAAAWGGVLPEGERHLKPDLQRFYTAWFGRHPEVVLCFPLADRSDLRPGLAQCLCPQCLHLGRLAEGEPRCPQCGSREALAVWVPQLSERQETAQGVRVHVSHDCPCCGGRDTLAIVGYRAATLGSVLIGALYGSRFNDDHKLIAFSDSVQDAAHRAGFFGARTYAQTVRNALAGFLRTRGERLPLPHLAEDFPAWWRRELGEAEFAATFIAPDMLWLRDYQALTRSGKLPPASRLPGLVFDRLRWEVLVEFGQRSRIGRTLERSGVATVRLDLEALGCTAARLGTALGEELESLRGVGRGAVLRFLWGLLTHLRQIGAFYAPVLDGYIAAGGREYLLNRLLFMPNYGFAARPPALLTRRPVFPNFEALASRRGTWCADWFAKTLGADALLATAEYEQACQLLLSHLEREGWLVAKSARGEPVWGLAPERWRLTRRLATLRCGRCRHELTVPAADVQPLEGLACLRRTCRGHYRFAGLPEGEEAYRAYPRRLVTSEHTALLDGQARKRIEESFIHGRHAWDVNLLSATPTLEMGIDIGDLSTVLLCSVPPAQANFLQRIGRAGRRDGNALAVTIANGRPHDLYFYAAPEEMMAGQVRPPGVFLQALAVLERQLTAYGFDRWVAGGVDEGALPVQLRPVLDAVERRDRSRFPYPWLAFIEREGESLLQGFFALFPQLDAEAQAHLRAFLEGRESRGGLGWRVLERLQVLVEHRAELKRRIRTLKRLIEQYERLPQDEARDERLAALQEERAGLMAFLRAENQRQTLNFFTDEGLLPNYAFPEEGVTLQSVILRRATPREVERDGRRYQVESVSFQRSAPAALSELAPQQRFYAVAHRLNVERVDLRLSSPETWHLCPQCHHAENLSEQGDRHAVCPRCGSPGWADLGQKRTLVRLRQAYARADTRHDRIADESEQREPLFYHRQTLVDIPEDAAQGGFHLAADDLPFGFEYLARATFREINFGPLAPDGESFSVAGETQPRKGFTLCRHCGVVKQGKSRKGTFAHALDCPLAREGAVEGPEDWLESLYLYRELTSEAVRIRLPLADVGESETGLHSFIAALGLGLKAYFRGDVHHLEITTMNLPAASGGMRRYLVIYDRIPGGSGYLKELLREPRNLLRMLELARQRLAGCGCAHDLARDGCYHCILAYRESRHMAVISRRVALELLEKILARADQLQPIERLVDLPDNGLLESELEQRFVSALKGQVQLICRTVGGKPGYQLEVGGRIWELELQVSYGPESGVAVPSRADFVLRPAREQERAAVPEIAIFLDGFSHHFDRLQADTRQRMALLASGRWVWSLGWHDLPDRREGRQPLTVGALLLGGLSAAGRARYDRLAERAGWRRAAEIEALVAEGPFRWLLRWLADPAAALAEFRQAALYAIIARLTQPGTQGRAAFQGWLPEAWLEECGGGEGVVIGAYPAEADWGKASAVVLAGVPRRALNSLAELRQTAFVGLSVDDTQARQDEDFHETWRGFWHAFNLLQFAPVFLGVARSGVAEHRYAGLALASREEDQEDRPSGWRAVFEHSVLDHADLERLRAAGLPPPQVGIDLMRDGAVVGTAELLWEAERVAVMLDEEAMVELPGWTLIRTGSDDWVGRVIASVGVR